MAVSNKKAIVLPESDDARILNAADILLRGCNVKGIVGVIAITAFQAHILNK